jgi:hypothetical protein
MKVWLAVGLVALVLAFPSTAPGQEVAKVGAMTMAQWYQWPTRDRAIWLWGAMGAFDLLGASCSAPPTVGAVESAMSLRYLAGKLKGTDRAVGGLVIVMTDHGCSFESEHMLAAVNAILKTIGADR